MRYKFLRRWLLLLLLATGLSVGVVQMSATHVFAAPGNAGHFYVVGDSSSWSYSNNVLQITGSAPITISMGDNALLIPENGALKTSSDRIVVASGVTANITLSDVRIESNSAAAFDMAGATVNLTILGYNALDSSLLNSPGFRVPAGSVLNITAASPDAFLGALGGMYAAGMGGNNIESGGTITINSGRFQFIGSYGGAGIGGGFYGDGGPVNIHSGEVVATGGTGAGIGSGSSGYNGGPVTINGGTVIAAAGANAAGIGGGASSAKGTLTITGGSVTRIGAAGRESTATNGTDPVYLATWNVIDSLSNPVKNTAVSSFTIDGLTYDYGVTNVMTDNNGKLFFWLPEGAGANDASVSVTINGMTYWKSIAWNASKEGTATITVPDSTISPTTATFHKNTADTSAGHYADVTTTLTLNGNTLSSIANGATLLVQDTDYTVSGNTVTIKKEYLALQPIGTTNLTFSFNYGNTQTLTITVSDNSTISPITATFDKNTANPGAGNYADVTTTLTLNGNTLSSIANGATTLVQDTDYTLDGSTVTIKKEYLAQQSIGTTSLTFTFSAGNPQTLTITVSDTTGAVIEAPVLQSVIAGNAQVTLAWIPVVGSTGYRVFTSVTSASYGTEVATVSGSVYSYTVTGLTNGQTYYFAVKAIKSGTDSDASNKVSAIPVTVPAAPTNVTAVADDGQGTVTFTTPTDNGGSVITRYEVTVSPGNWIVTGTSSPIVITGLSNGTSYTFTVRAVSSVGSSAPSAESNAVVPSSPSSGNVTPSQPAPSPVSEQTDPVVEVLVNGKAEKAGTASTSIRNGQSLTTITIDPQKLNDRLSGEGEHAVVTIPVNTGSDVVVGELNGQMVKNMEDKQAVLEMKTDHATYKIPAQQINIKAVSEQIGNSVALQDIKIQVEIATPTADTVKWIENAAVNGAFTLVVPPLEFTVRATYGEAVIEISRFDAYVERTIAIPDAVDPSKITTGVVIDPDGTVRHVPTKIIQIDGKYYARINSLTNSPYAVVWSPLEFKDVADHWAMLAVNDMGSRMVIDGIGNGLFLPDRDITRAEFASILVRGLGLKPERGATPFSDVRVSDWFSSAIYTAYAYQLINGFEDGTFRPNEKITREQVMVILSKAMLITGLKAELPVSSADTTLRSFEDGAEVSTWAQRSVADSVQAGLVSGRSAAHLALMEYVTRAECATVIQRLLQISGLI